MVNTLYNLKFLQKAADNFGRKKERIITRRKRPKTKEVFKSLFVRLKNT